MTKGAERSTKKRRRSVPRTVLQRIVALVVTGVSLYVLLPTLLKVFDAWPQLARLAPAWFAAAALCELASFTCNVALQRLVLRTKSWFAPWVAWLLGNAVTSVVPGGSAAGITVQYKVLATAGVDTDAAKGGLAAAGLLNTVGLLSLPLVSLPIVLTGAHVKPEFIRTGILGAIAFVACVIFIVLVLRYDWPLKLVGRALGWLLHHLPGHHASTAEITKRLLEQRDEIRALLGKEWRRAALFTAGRLGFDFLCLLCLVRSTGTDTNPGIVLLVYTGAEVVALLPFTPGGLGIVEAGLSGLLVLSGMSSGRAVLATLAYRLLSYWLPVVGGAVAYPLARRRYGPLIVHDADSDAEAATSDGGEGTTDHPAPSAPGRSTEQGRG